MEPALEISGLSISYGALHAVRDLSISIAPGEAYGLIGESGSGKSSVAYAVMRHLPAARLGATRLALHGRDLLTLTPRQLASVRGSRIAMVYQDPVSALNPMLRVGEQVAEVLRRHRAQTDARAQTLALFEQVHLPDPAAIARRYPHQLSGGQQQRVVIAMAIACQPELLIMDEPTTGLDVTTEAVILDLIFEIRRSLGAAVLFISHNLAVVAKVCDRVGVLYAGQLVEEGPVLEVLRAPRHPYTIGLLEAVPNPDARSGQLRAIPGNLPDLREVPIGCIFRARCDVAFSKCTNMPPLYPRGAGHLSRCHLDAPEYAAPRPSTLTPARTEQSPRLQIENLSRWFHPGAFARLAGAEPVRAVTDIFLDVPQGRTLAIIGESGSGKSTLARCVAGLLAPGRGQIRLDGRVLAPTVQRRQRSEQQAIQFIFQSPQAALNPHHTVAEIVARPLQLFTNQRGASLWRRLDELLATVQLPSRYGARYPGELSGGEQQRVCIARAFAASPLLVICDEPTSALDISVQAAILNELLSLQARFGTSYLFISHDLAVVRHVADHVAVMYQGRVLEQGAPDEVFSAPEHPYTRALLAAVPRLDRGEPKAETDAPAVR